MNYKTEEEAKARLDDAKFKMGTKICPLFRTLCRENCIAYYPGKVYGVGDSWRICKPRCTSPMINGEIVVAT